MLIVPIATLKDNYVWTLIDASKRYAIVVDPGEAAPVFTYLREHELELCGILLTHHHWDHTNGTEELQTHYLCTVFGPGH